MADEESVVVLEERVVLEKFDGDVTDGRLVERITIVDGDVVVERITIVDGDVVVERETFPIEEVV